MLILESHKTTTWMRIDWVARVSKRTIKISLYIYINIYINSCIYKSKKGGE